MASLLHHPTLDQSPPEYEVKETPCSPHVIDMDEALLTPSAPQPPAAPPATQAPALLPALTLRNLCRAIALLIGAAQVVVVVYLVVTHKDDKIFWSSPSAVILKATVAAACLQIASGLLKSLVKDEVWWSIVVAIMAPMTGIFASVFIYKAYPNIIR